ncbi:aspartyl/glutamyl-tRNA amidotransferase subunit B [endosymbiont of Acanthamoeba sp. UWC8]|uniref:Asp-tRNA(Asn)/Glu-tRNA(Gln) amidotransferase subunit GatB n=1 Tax=endosymbiont of Acanthamoeba sp. UWC8 TaxID=86106 RepID=UPI0004D11D6E|nr:Asp-tRNA(Asn)/Glu-tRNA(Gln) amidotransferase subunit GatB [endosymbiont of Acanthamoeba sp. UWC8]AIF81912.1 aspartyl/glutamyl-tRNA amidotransferase subunit B [endosymbiont of Acanthamoeba sp. UWC8]
MVAQIIKGVTGDWELVIGLEIHAQVSSKSKLFSGSSTEFGAEPNTQVSFVDAAMPGMLPVINEKCIEQAVRTGLGIGAQINKFSVFDRKNYFYPDLPQGYQISQFKDPIVGRGVVHVDMPGGSVKEVGITRIHLEQDAGKSIHDQSPTETYIDLNRSGIALMEIVTEPDIRSSEEAGEFMKKLRSILRYLETCDGDMEKGSLRCDANVSVRRVGAKEYGTRAEIKNVNSIKNIIRAIEFEAARQVDLIEGGGIVDQETRLFDASLNETRSMRSKEDAQDYRYFPDPDLLPLTLTDEYIENIRKSLPELPDQKKERYIKQMGLSVYDAGVIVADQEVAKYFEEAAQNADAKLVANWITAELFGRLNRAGLEIEQSPIKAKQVGDLVKLIKDGTISGKIAKQVFDIMFETGDEPKAIVEREGLVQVSDTKAIEQLIEQVLIENQDKVNEYRSGKDKLFGFFVGQVMKLSQGKFNPSIVNDLLVQKLKG